MRLNYTNRFLVFKFSASITSAAAAYSSDTSLNAITIGSLDGFLLDIDGQNGNPQHSGKG